MKYQIRKVSEVKVYSASEPIEIDSEKFRDVSPPYTGNSEQEFVQYLASLFPFNIPDDLDFETSELLLKLLDSATVEYANSLEKGSNDALQVGVEDKTYRKTGGFRVASEAGF